MQRCIMHHRLSGERTRAWLTSIEIAGLTLPVAVRKQASDWVAAEGLNGYGITHPTIFAYQPTRKAAVAAFKQALESHPDARGIVERVLATPPGPQHPFEILPAPQRCPQAGFPRKGARRQAFPAGRLSP